MNKIQISISHSLREFLFFPFHLFFFLLFLFLSSTLRVSSSGNFLPPQTVCSSALSLPVSVSLGFPLFFCSKTLAIIGTRAKVYIYNLLSVFCRYNIVFTGGLYWVLLTVFLVLTRFFYHTLLLVSPPLNITTLFICYLLLFLLFFLLLIIF